MNGETSPNPINPNQENADYEDFVENGGNLLKTINRDFLASPRMLVRGIYKGEILRLTVQRRTEGRLVSWSMKDVKNDTYVLNVKAKMRYSYDIAGGHKFGHRLRGGKGWEGFGYGFVNLFPGSDSSIKHIDIHEAVFCEDSNFYHYCGLNCKRITEDILCKEHGCGTRVWTIEFTAYSTMTRERGLYDISCNLIKDKLTEQVYISMVAFFDGTYQLVVHRAGQCKSSAEVVAWLKKDSSARFYDKPDVNEATLDNRSYFIWQTKPRTESMSKLLG